MQPNDAGALTPGDAFPPTWRPARDGSFAADGDALLFEHWSDADFTLNGRIAALRAVTRDVRPTTAQVRLDWYIAALGDIRDSLSQLRVFVTNARASRRIQKDSLLVQYLADAYVWTGDALADVSALAEELDGGRAGAGDGSVADSLAYIVEFLEPLHRGIESHRANLGVDSTLRHVLPLTARLHSAIVALEWDLRTAA